MIHSYLSGWQGPGTIPDDPVEGALAWLREMVEDGRFEVVIFSSRNGLAGGVDAMKAWLADWGSALFGADAGWVDELTFPDRKPPAHLTLDDRAVRFSGTFPSPDVVAAFKPWYK